MLDKLKFWPSYGNRGRSGDQQNVSQFIFWATCPSAKEIEWLSIQQLLRYFCLNLMGGLTNPAITKVTPLVRLKTSRTVSLYIISPPYFSYRFAGIEGTAEVQVLWKPSWMLFDRHHSILNTQKQFCIQITAIEFVATSNTILISICMF